MTITDELLYEILKPNSNGKISDNAPIMDIIGKKEIVYKIEKSTAYTQKIGSGKSVEFNIVKITPDILVRVSSQNGIPKTNNGPNSKSEQYVALEIENDIHWDFQKSLRKLKKYKTRFPDTRVIIPKMYERFAPFYVNEGIQVYLWDAKRRWQCLKCETETAKTGLVTPKCSNLKCKNYKKNEFKLIGLKDTNISKYE
jgi:hypothetical protein